MKKTLPWILLALSLAFNVSFVLGMFHARHHRGLPKTTEGRVELFAGMLELDKQQIERFRVLDKKVSVGRDAFKEKMRERSEQFWVEIVKDNPDEAVLNEFTQPGPRVGHRQKFVQHMREFIAILRPDQRRKAAEFFRKFHPRRH